MDIQRKAFENLWLAGGGNFDNFIFSEDQGKYVAIENSNLTDKQKEMALYVVNNAYLFFVGGFKQAAKAQAVPEWISVENTTPNKNGDYIVCIDGEPCSAFFKWVNDHWKEFKAGAGITEGIHGWWHTHLNVTHWMLLPKPPKAQEPAND